MENSKSYKELEVWKEARKLVKLIYENTQQFSERKKFGLTLQIRRAAVSIVSNIAEGIGRNHTKDTLQFLFISKGSVYELETQVLLSVDLGFLTEERSEEVLAQLILVKKLLHGFITYYQKKMAVH